MWLAICTWLNSFHTREPPNFWKPQKGGLNTLKYLVFINSFPFASVLLLTGVPQLYYEWVIFIYVSILSIITICIKICSESQNTRCTEPACYNGYLQSYNYIMYWCVTKEGKTLLSIYNVYTLHICIYICIHTGKYIAYINCIHGHGTKWAKEANIWPKMPILGQICPILGQKSDFFCE